MESIRTFKDEGDTLLAAGSTAKAIEAYNKGLELVGSIDQTSSDLVKLAEELYCARGEAHLMAGDYNAALANGEAATALCPKSYAGFFLSGRACMGLHMYHEARDHLLDAAGHCTDRVEKRKILRVSEEAGKHAGPLSGSVLPSNPFVSAAAATTEHPWWEQPGRTVCDVFEEHLATDKAFAVPESYAGPRVSRPPKLEEVRAMAEYFRTARQPLHPRYAVTIALDAWKTFRDLPSLVEVPVPDGAQITVCGDIHGQFYDLLHIFELNGWPAQDNPYLFNGDFVDRGSFSCEVILTLLALRALYPTALFMARGNHETASLTRTYGFSNEATSKYGPAFEALMTEVFCYLPLAHILADKVFVVHGGLSAAEREDGSLDPCSLDDIRREERRCQPHEDGSGIMNDLLWSDPQDSPGKRPTERRAGYFFGPDVTRKFLWKNNLRLVVRSHEVKMGGYEVQHNGLLVTLFSAPNYCGNCGNYGAYIRFTAPKMKPVYTTFKDTPH